MGRADDLAMKCGVDVTGVIYSEEGFSLDVENRSVMPFNNSSSYEITFNFVSHDRTHSTIAAATK
jgi:hypothetical protein